MRPVEDRLKELGLSLGPAKDHVANYLGTKQVGNILYVSGRKSDLMGAVGTAVTESQAKEAARHTVLLLLAIIKRDIGNLDKIEGIIKLQGFIKSSADFTRQPQVLDGATELLIELFGESGRHARTATGVYQPPYGATVQIDMIVQLKEEEEHML